MAYTAPKTWAVGDPLTASDMNTYVSNNVAALKAPPTSVANINEASDYTTTNTSFVDVDGTDLAETITTTGGDVLICFTGRIAGTARVYLNVAMDGADLVANDGVTMNGDSGTSQGISFVFLHTGIAAGLHTFKLRWKVNAGTGTMHAGAGTAALDIHPHFWAREVS